MLNEIELKGNASDYLAAERTFLAWVRTALALMGFGFVVAPFGLFLRELQVTQPSQPARGYGFSLWFGTALIVLGTIVSVSSPWRYVRLVQDLNHGGTSPPDGPQVLKMVDTPYLRNPSNCRK